MSSCEECIAVVDPVQVRPPAVRTGTTLAGSIAAAAAVMPSVLQALNQTDPVVRQMYIEWLHWYIAKFGWDGFRVDAANNALPEVHKEIKAVGTFATGERRCPLPFFCCCAV